MNQFPQCGDHLLQWRGDVLEVVLRLDSPRAGRAFLRGDFGAAEVRRREIVDCNDLARPALSEAWNDREMRLRAPGEYVCEVPLDEVGVFAGKCFFLPTGASEAEWPEGDNFHVKVAPASARGGNSIYTVFPRQFGSFREVVRRLDVIMDQMGFRIIQTLPVFPVPATYAVMGEYGCPFAATDFFSVDPAMAEFDTHTTPLDQFRELVDAVHARGGRLFVDLPANHTGWASALQTHHPEWFRRKDDGAFASPGAWGVTWADLVELDYSHPELRTYMAEVFLFWVRNGVDGFRCDAGYMIPEDTWQYIVARVRAVAPETVFMLEGLGGLLAVTDRLLGASGLDWAYSEIFQTYDRAAFEWYMPPAIQRSRTLGTLVHFAETHDNDRLAKKGETYARLRVGLAALLSMQGAWGIANGVEWFATEKIDVHGKNDLNWGAERNLVDFIAQLNSLISSHPDFDGNGDIRFIQQGGGNFLAALRGSTLILANLDCEHGVAAHWDTGTYPDSGERHDLLLGREVRAESGLWLDPGEIRVLSSVPMGEGGEKPMRHAEREQEAARPENTVHFRYPLDARRDVCVPAGCELEVSAEHPLRVCLLDGERVVKVVSGPDGLVRLTPPEYAGDGTRSNRYQLELVVCTPGATLRERVTVHVLPPAERARMQLAYTGEEIRRNPALETVLGSRRGGAARVKLGWGEVRSQYDALFAANPDPDVPADRLTLWTRCRAWLQCDGYSYEINRDCVQRFCADPAGRFAQWRFRVPCGNHRSVAFAFTLALSESANAARLSITLLETNGELPRIRFVLRPDLEWRSFHGTTKAQGAVENAFGRPGALAVARDGFRFEPYPGGGALRFRVKGGECHEDVQWVYNVPHPEELARGQEGSGDLFSPVWIACDVHGDEVAAVDCSFESPGQAKAQKLDFPSVNGNFGDEPASPLAEGLAAALRLYVVDRDDVQTVIAGYPWFLDWGRDTFIFLQGAIPAGFRREALSIVEAFARFEENGTLPNIIHGRTAGNRDTVDAPLWFIRTLQLLGAKGARFRSVAESIVEHYLAGTPNGIHVDEDSGLVWSPSHFTWMDTNYPACTPRVGYPVEIQALWISALRYLGGKKWNALAKKAQASLVRLFAAKGRGLADCLDAPNGERAADAHPDWGVRPNQLFVVSLNALDSVEPATRQELERSIVRACERLVVPGGVRSLAAGDVRYCGVYAGDEDSSRKPAYHNGTVWAWPFPMFAEALAKTGLASPEVAQSLLTSAVENLNLGCVCHVSEIADGDAPHAQKGCLAQAWSDSELLRVWLALEKMKKGTK